MHDVILKLSFVVASGLAAQWIAWRVRLPAIVVLLFVGLIAGPVTGLVSPQRDFGESYRSVVSIAVAFVLFEGGLTLNFGQLGKAAKGVRRLILLAGPLIGVSTALAARYIAGFSWPTATVLGAILIVTGPTVINPLLRQARLAPRPAALLRWEAIINDPVGALFAVVAYEMFLVLHGSSHMGELAVRLAAAAGLAAIGGYGIARLLAWAFTRAFVPEFLKVPVVAGAVLAAYAGTNLVLEEAGLLAVTVMGVSLANTRIASLAEMRRFKETFSVLLVSGLFVLLTAALSWADFQSIGWRVGLFVLCVIVVIRPLGVLLATSRADLPLRERLLVGWIGPRGIVAVAVAGLFGTALQTKGVEDASGLLPVAFAVVFATIVAHGFTLRPFARWLGLQTVATPGILIVGGSPITTALGRKLVELDIPVLIADTEWIHLRDARLADIPVHFGEILSERAHNQIDFSRFSKVIAATPNEAYNALVCTNLGPDVGRSDVFELGQARRNSERTSLHFTVGGRPLTRDVNFGYVSANTKVALGWEFRATTLSESFSFEDHELGPRGKGIVLFWRKPSGELVFASIAESQPGPGDTIVSFVPPEALDSASTTPAQRTG